MKAISNIYVQLCNKAILMNIVSAKVFFTIQQGLKCLIIFTIYAYNAYKRR